MELEELLDTELLEDGPLDETLRLEEVPDVDDGLEELEILEEEAPVELTLDNTGESRLDDTLDEVEVQEADERVGDTLDSTLEDEDVEDRMEEVDMLEDVVDSDG
jgi:hypothetical protein